MKITDKELQEAIDSKMRQKEICAKYSVSKGYVSARLKTIRSRASPSIPYADTRGPNVPVGRKFDLKRGDKVKVKGEIYKVGTVSKNVFQVIHNGVGGKVKCAYQEKDYVYRLESIEKC